MNPLCGLKQTEEVIVFFSGGKDSIVVLDMCFKYFKTVYPVFMYVVKNLSFQERYLTYIEKKYRISFFRYPHWSLSRMYKENNYRPYSKNAKDIKLIYLRDVENQAREATGGVYIASGHKAIDSLDRNAMIRGCKGIDDKNKRIYPLAFYNNAMVFNYLKRNNILLPPDYRLFKYSKNSSFGGINGDDLEVVRENYPDDYRKILEVFPFAEAAVKRKEFANNQVSEV